MARRARNGWLLGVIAGLLVVGAPAWADCVDGVREATAAERDFAQRARAALIAALPEAVRPLQRSRGERPDPGAPVSLALCAGSPIGAWSPSAGASLVHEFSPEEARARSEYRRVLLREADELERLPPEKEAQRKELEAQMRAAYDAAPRRSRKDPPFTAEQQAQADRASAEGRRLEEAMRRVSFDHQASVKLQTAPLRERADLYQQGPQTFAVQVAMNAARFPEPPPPARGVVITLGAPSPRASATLRAVNLVVSVEGPAGPAREALVGLIDRAYLEGLIGAPVPEVAASRARIDGRIAQASSAPPLAIASSVPAHAQAAAPAGAPPASAGAGAAAASPSAGAGPAAAAAASAPSASVPDARAATAPSAACPPRGAQTPADAGRAGRDLGSEVGGAVLGGGWGRSLGASVGGVLGALGGARKPEPAGVPADCPR